MSNDQSPMTHGFVTICIDPLALVHRTSLNDCRSNDNSLTGESADMTVLRRSFAAVVFVLLIGLLLSSCAEKTVQAPAPPAEPVAVVIEGAQVWDGTGAPPVQDAVVVIKGDRIDAI